MVLTITTVQFQLIEVNAWVDAPSLGKYYNANIKGNYDCRINPTPEYQVSKLGICMSIGDGYLESSKGGSINIS